MKNTLIVLNLVWAALMIHMGNYGLAVFNFCAFLFLIS
jgi:hypothetical protein